MKIVIVMDSFKGSVTSIEAGKAAKKGIEAAYREQSQPEISVLPIADGGEGTIDAIFHRFSEQIQTSTVQGPMLGQTVLAKHGQIAKKVGRDFRDYPRGKRETKSLGGDDLWLRRKDQAVHSRRSSSFCYWTWGECHK